VAHGIRLYQLRRFGEATKVFEAVRAEHPHYPQATRWLGRAHIEMGKPEAGVALIREAMQEGSRRSDPAWLAHGLVRLGRTEEARAIVEEIQRRDPDQQPNFYHVARVWASLGDLESTLETLDEARRRCQSSNMIWGVSFDSFRDDARFIAALESFGYGPGVQARWAKLIANTTRANSP
jgi:tetratricopeptide (TPR) repeat protein